MQEEAPIRATAGIVIFNPDEDNVVRLVASVAPDIREVLVFGNSEVSPAFEQALIAAAAPASCRIQRSQDNVGLGTAYDAILAAAREAGDRFVLLLDQDSLPPPHAVRDLARLHDALCAAGERPAIVGPQPVEPGGHPMRLTLSRGRTPGGLAGEVTRASFVISSGSLLDVEAAALIGPFRTDYFIDAIDIEWCFRAEARGFSIWVARRVLMEHRLGRGIIRIPLFDIQLADQPPRRLYTYLRNQLAMLRLAHIPRYYKLRILATMPLRIPIYLARNGFSRDTRAAIRNGLRDGLAGRLGPPTDAFR